MTMAANIEHMSQDELPVSRQHSLYEFAAVLLFVSLLLWGGQHLLDPATLPIRQVRIEGEFRHLSTATLQELASNRVQGGFFNIDVAAIRDALLAEPWVREVSVHRVWPDSLQIFVTEQTPLARWQAGGFLNEEATLFKPVVDSVSESLPVFAGPRGTEKLMLEQYQYLQELLRPLNMQVTVLQLDERRAWEFITLSGLQVIIGRKDPEVRITRFAALVPGSLGQKLETAAVIDMRYPNGYAVRWKDGTAANHTQGGETSTW